MIQIWVSCVQLQGYFSCDPVWLAWYCGNLLALGRIDDKYQLWALMELLEVLLKVSLSSTNETSNGVITFQSCPRRNWQSKMDLPGTASVQILEQIFHFKNILKFWSPSKYVHLLLKTRYFFEISSSFEINW